MKLEDPISYDMDEMAARVVQYCQVIYYFIIEVVSLFVNCSQKLLFHGTLQSSTLYTVQDSKVQLSPVWQMGQMDFESSTVKLGKLELIHLSYWDKWKWANCHIETNGTESTVLVTNCHCANCHCANCLIESTVIEPTVVEPTVILPDVVAS